MTTNQPAIEPVTDEDVMVALNLPARALEPHTRRILEQDRLRVAERQIAASLDGGEFYRLNDAKAEIERLRAEVAKMHARRAVLFGELTELKRAIENGHQSSAIAIIDAIARVIPDQSKMLAELRAEVARLTAACAAKDQAIRRIFTPGNLSPETRVFVEAALSTDVGKGWIDATGAVEVIATACVDGRFATVVCSVPYEWHGKSVLIVRKP